MAIVLSPDQLAKFPPRGPSRVDFWGYGLEADPSVVEAISQTDEGLYVVGGVKKAIAENIQLVVQGIDQVPKHARDYSPRDILAENWRHTGEPFASYSIAESEGSRTAGTLYVITNIAIVEALNAWDMVPDWRGRTVVHLNEIDGEETGLGPTLTFAARSENPAVVYERTADGMDYAMHLFGEDNTKIAIANFVAGQSK